MSEFPSNYIPDTEATHSWRITFDTIVDLGHRVPALTRYLLPIALAVTVAACGGGGNGNAKSAPQSSDFIQFILQEINALFDPTVQADRNNMRTTATAGAQELATMAVAATDLSATEVNLTAIIIATGTPPPPTPGQ